MENIDKYSHRLSIKNNELYLKAENHNYPDFRFKNHIDVHIWGVVIYSIHSYLCPFQVLMR